MRVALYARVSTEEQVRHGLSIDAQIESLRSWAKDHEVVGEYIDEGISARKAPSKRPELQRLLADIPRLKIELIAFTKLDRWSRNVKGYYQIQDTLDRNGTAWIATQEDYETITAGGRFKTNIMLSVAENEADRTGERIKAVYAHKVALGQPINGSLPLGLRIEGKSIVPDEYAPAVADAFRTYAETGSRNAAQQAIAAHGKRLCLNAIAKLLKNRLYIGEYRDNPNYCQPIIDRDLFFRVQHDIASRSTKGSPSGRVYLFSGVIFCGECGRHLAAVYNSGITYYRCPKSYESLHYCSNRKYYREDQIEEAVTNAIAEAVKGISTTVKPRKKKPSNKAAIEAKLARLRELYLDGDIPKDQYKLRRDELAAQIRPAEIVKEKVVIGDNFRQEYADLPAEKKKTFLRSVIDKVVINPDGADVFFSVDYTNHTPSDDEL